MITAAQMAHIISRRQYASSAVGEVVLLSEILTTLCTADPLHSKIVALFEDGSDVSWPQDYDKILAEARRRMV